MEELWTRQFGENHRLDARRFNKNSFWNSTFGSDHGRVELRGKRLELPIFEGKNSFGWLFRVEHYFTINGIAEGDKVFVASMCLEGHVLN